MESSRPATAHAWAETGATGASQLRAADPVSAGDFATIDRMSSHQVPERVQGNIEAMTRLRDEVELGIDPHQRVIERGARALGRPRTFYILVVTVTAWIALNVYLIWSGSPPLDEPPFFWLQGALAIYVALVSTMVLVAQSRQGREADRQAHLELHVALLAEQKTTKLISLLEELRRDLPNVINRKDEVAESMEQEFDPKAVHSKLSE